MEFFKRILLRILPIFMLPIEAQIYELITPSLEPMGYDLVRVKLGEQNGKHLQIMAERKEDKQLGVDDCATISHTVSALLDVDDIIADAFNLEVSSPGIDRPLVRVSDYELYTGHVAKITTKTPIEGRRKFKGPIKAISDEGTHVTLTLEDASVDATIPLEYIDQAQLLLTDALIEFEKNRIQSTSRR